MRIDKFLKVSRIIKRRQVAKEACVAGRVLINSSVAKAGSLVHEGDIIEVVFGSRALKVKVLKLNSSASKSEANELYEIID